MFTLENIHTAAAVITIALGVISFLRAKQVVKLVGLAIEDVKGLIEVKAVYGGSFLAMGIACLVINTPVAYDMLGAMWLGTGIARLVALSLSKVVLKPNITLLFLIVEFVVGILLILG